MSLTGENNNSKETEHYKSNRMGEGLLWEDESRTLYELTHSVEVRRVALCYRDEEKKYHISPDGLILEKKEVLKQKMRYLKFRYRDF